MTAATPKADKTRKPDPKAAKVRLARIGQRKLGWSDDAYYQLLADRYGKDSTKKLRWDELNDLIDHMASCGFEPARKGGGGRKRPELPQEYQRKALALWLALWHLGATRDSSDRALDHFVARQTGIAALRWLPPERANRVIEALKSWAAREGGVDWSPYRITTCLKPLVREDVPDPRARVIEAQWRLLRRLGAVRIEDGFALHHWLRGRGYDGPDCKIGPFRLPRDKAIAAMAELGAWIRRAKGRADG